MTNNILVQNVTKNEYKQIQQQQRLEPIQPLQRATQNIQRSIYDTDDISTQYYEREQKMSQQQPEQKQSTDFISPQQHFPEPKSQQQQQTVAPGQSFFTHFSSLFSSADGFTGFGD